MNKNPENLNFAEFLAFLSSVGIGLSNVYVGLKLPRIEQLNQKCFKSLIYLYSAIWTSCHLVDLFDITVVLYGVNVLILKR